MMEKRNHLFIFAGEKSGDLHGGHFVKELKKKLPQVNVEGVAGPTMRTHGVKGPLTMEDFEVMGLTDVLLGLPKLYKYFYKIRDYILSHKPEVTLLIDYPGFNLRLAKALRKQGYEGKIIQYVSPTVWAHGAHRIQTMVDTLDGLLTIYPFESQYYAGTNLKVSYIGNPLCEYLKNYRYDEKWKSKIGLPESKRLIALFPGSRKNEILRNLPIIIDTAKMIVKEAPETIFGISCAHKDTEAILRSLLPEGLQKAFFPIPSAYTYELMRDSYLALAKSGTVTLELALHERPTIVIYKLTALNRFYAKSILKLNLPHYCIVNILAGKRVFPELIEDQLTSEHLYTQFKWLNEEKHFESCRQECAAIHRLLAGSRNASSNAVSVIESMFSC